MKNLLVTLLLLVSVNVFAAYTEFYVQTTGSNLNGGGTATDAATYTGVGDSDGTSIFTPSDGSTPASSVNVGDFASVYVTAGATTNTFNGRVTAVAAGVNGAITVSTTAKAGTFPSASAGAHTITCKVGGAWKGPNAAVGFPFGFVGGTLTNASGDSPCFNFKNGVTYSITAGLTYATADNLTVTTFQGYTTTVHDGGRAIIDGGTSGTSYVLFTGSGKNFLIADFVFQNNGATGSADGVSTAGTENSFFRCVFHDVRGNGLIMTAGPASATSCEAYNCNQSNTTACGGFSLQSSGCDAKYCIAHHNTSSSSRGIGFEMDGGIHLEHCIAAYNNYGVRSTADVQQSIDQCGFIGNTVQGVAFQQGGNDPLGITILNCSFFGNGGWGILFGGPYANGIILNCVFGSGTQANTSGTISGGNGILVAGSITYTLNLTPYVAPTTGDFRNVAGPSRGAGWGTFMQTYTGSTWTGTVGYSDTGAAQHLDSATGGSYTFQQ